MSAPRAPLALVALLVAALCAACGDGEREDQRTDAGVDLVPSEGGLADRAGLDASTADAPGPRLSLSPARVVFPLAAVGCLGEPVLLTVTNDGTDVAGPLATSIEGMGAASFRIATDGCVGKILRPSGRCEISIRPGPLSIGLRRAVLSVAATPGETATVADLEVTGVSVGEVTVIPERGEFAAAVVGMRAPPITFRLPHVGGGRAVSVKAAIGGGGNRSDFVIERDDCSAAPVEPGTACEVVVAFTPRADGARFGTFVLASADTACGGFTAIVPLSGTGIAGDAGVPPLGPRLLPSPLQPMFHKGRPGCQNASVPLTITNDGDAPSGPLGVAVEGMDATSFDASSNDCRGKTLVPGGTCQIGIIYAPAALGSHAAVLVVAGGSGGRVMIPLAARAVPDDLITVLPGFATFGRVEIGGRSAPVSFRISNSDQEAGVLGPARLSGANPGDFAILEDGCGNAPIPPGATCQMTVAFAPINPGPRNGSLVIAGPGCGGGVGSVSLSGTGVLPDAGTDGAP